MPRRSRRRWRTSSICSNRRHRGPHPPHPPSSSARRCIRRSPVLKPFKILNFLERDTQYTPVRAEEGAIYVHVDDVVIVHEIARRVRAAISVMISQPSGGTVFNMDGSGSRGNPTPNSVAYGASKAALPQLAKSLARETRGTGVRVHLASPGMVTTYLLLRDASPSSLKVFNILADHPETTAAWLVPRMRAAHIDALPSGLYIRYLTTLSAMGRFATAPWRRDRLVKVPAS